MGGVGQRVHKPLLGVADTNHLLSIHIWVMLGNAEQVVGLCNTQQRLVYLLPHTSHTRCPRWDAPPWPRWEVSERMLHPEKYFDLRDFFCGWVRYCGDKRVARSLGRWRVVLASKSPEATSVQTDVGGEIVYCMPV